MRECAWPSRFWGSASGVPTPGAGALRKTLSSRMAAHEIRREPMKSQDARCEGVLVQREMESGRFPVSEYKAILGQSGRYAQCSPRGSLAANWFQKKSGWLVPPRIHAALTT